MSGLASYDCETHLIQPGDAAPRLVCGSRMEPGSKPRLMSDGRALRWLREWLEAGGSIVGHNVAFDMAVACAADSSMIGPIFEAYEEDRVYCTQVREMLGLIKRGRLGVSGHLLSLGALAKKYLGLDLDKADDSWRYRYAELEDTPVSSWPSRARRYACLDAQATLQVFSAQEYMSPDEPLQVRAAFALYLMQVWGVRTNATRVEALQIKVDEAYGRVAKVLRACGIMRTALRKNGPKKGQPTKRDGTIDTKVLGEHIIRELGPDVERTQRGVKADDKVLAMCHSPELEAYSEYQKINKIRTAFLPALWRGTEVPLNPGFNVLVESGRTSCRSGENKKGERTGLNLQQMPRGFDVRECFEPRPGCVYVACDWNSAELVALGQVCWSWFGQSSFRTAFVQGRDPHLAFGAKLMGITYEEAQARIEDDEEVAQFRQRAKVCNFGYPGGLGAAAFVQYAKGYGLKLSMQDSRDLKAGWLAAHPEMREYFRVVADICDPIVSGTRTGIVEQYGSGRIRGGCRFTVAANTFFQGLVADAGKLAMWEVAKGCYYDQSSPLYLSRPVAFIHDEILMESPEDLYADAGAELQRIMIESLARLCPDVPVKADVTAMRVWSKKAKSLTDKQGRLRIWEPKEKKQ